MANFDYKYDARVVGFFLLFLSQDLMVIVFVYNVINLYIFD